MRATSVPTPETWAELRDWALDSDADPRVLRALMERLPAPADWDELLPFSMCLVRLLPDGVSLGTPDKAMAGIGWVWRVTPRGAPRRDDGSTETYGRFYVRRDRWPLVSFIDMTSTGNIMTSVVPDLVSDANLSEFLSMARGWVS